MLCDICKKNKANVHLTEIINEEVTELHLCEECAKAKGAEMEQHFSIADLLSGLVDFPMEASRRKEHVKIKCQNCGMSYADFKKLGRFGCSQCYEAFKRALYPLLKRIHGTTHHAGRQPEALPAKKTKPAEVKIRTKNELDELKARLVKVIQDERFEEAAMLRDRIKILEEKARNQ